MSKEDPNFLGPDGTFNASARDDKSLIISSPEILDIEFVHLKDCQVEDLHIANCGIRNLKFLKDLITLKNLKLSNLPHLIIDMDEIPNVETLTIVNVNGAKVWGDYSETILRLDKIKYFMIDDTDLLIRNKIG